MSDQGRSPRHAVEVHGVDKSFGRAVVLSGLDLTVEHGELVCVTGPSGAGKSTLIHLLAALDRPDRGRLVVEGFDTSHRGRATRFRRDTVGIVFQLHNVLPNLTAAENVEVAMLGTSVHRADRRSRAQELLAEVGLAAMADKRPPTLSGGERQRVAIARALANEPRVLLADEPTGSLDDESAAVVLDALQRRQRERGLTIVAVTHDERLERRAGRTIALAASSGRG